MGSGSDVTINGDNSDEAHCSPLTKKEHCLSLKQVKLIKCISQTPTKQEPDSETPPAISKYSCWMPSELKPNLGHE